MTSGNGGRVAISGASGFLGRAISDSFTRDGWTVQRLVRRSAGPGEVEWRPDDGWVDHAPLDGIDAFVHLAGENIFGVWTEAKKRRIMESRARGTRAVAEALAQLSSPPAVLVSASGVNYYGDSGEEVLREDSPPGSDFLAGVCLAWEASTQPAADAGIRVVRNRLGIVLDQGGGALSMMLPAFRFGLGATIGSGQQWMSWITLKDAVRAFRFTVGDEGLQGAVNAVSPEPVRNREFTTALAAAVHRPSLLSVPSFAVRAFPGGMGEALLLGSQRAVPTVLEERGFTFQHRSIDGALAAGLDGNG